MSLVRIILSALHAALTLGCGLQQVELGPSSADVIILDEVPRDAIARLQEVAADEKTDPMLALDYPADGTAVPANLSPITFVFGDDKKALDPMMMKPKRGFRAFELRLTGANSDLRLYTTSTRPGVPLARWRALLTAEQHTDVNVVVRALADDDRVVAGRPSKLRVLGPTRTGSIAYWNDTLGAAARTPLDSEGVTTFGASDYPTLEPWQSRSADGSHVASSRDGVLSATVDGTALVVPWATTLRIDYGSWAPDGAALVFVVTADTMLLEPGMMMPGMMMPGMMMPGMMMPGMVMPEPSIAKSAVMQTHVRSATELAEPELLFEADMPNEVVRAPSYSPDGRYIAFERAGAKDKAANLWLMPAQGGEASQVGGALAWKGEGAFPTWLPAVDGGYWLVFSRAEAPGEAKLAATQLQLWAVALELANRVTPEAVGEPFWLPFQSASDSNRRALFVEP